MKIKIFLIYMVMLNLNVLSFNCFSQMNSYRKIYFMREKKSYCFLISMQIQINDSNICRLKNGDRLIFSTNQKDTLKIEIIYPPIQKYKSKIIYIYPADENEIYIDLNYSGNTDLLTIYKDMRFSVNAKLMNYNEGVVKFGKNRLFSKRIFFANKSQ